MIGCDQAVSNAYTGTIPMECRRLAEKERRPRSELRRRLLPLGIFFETAISAVVAKLLRDQAEALWKH